MFDIEVRDAERSLTWMVSCPWRGLERISQATFKNNALDSWRVAWLGLLGKTDSWCIGISYFSCTHTYTEAASCRAEMGSGKLSNSLAPSPNLSGLVSDELQAEARWKGGCCATRDSSCSTPISSPFLPCIVSRPINIHKSSFIVFALFYHAHRPDPFLP